MWHTLFCFSSTNFLEGIIITKHNSMISKKKKSTLYSFLWKYLIPFAIGSFAPLLERVSDLRTKHKAENLYNDRKK